MSASLDEALALLSLFFAPGVGKVGQRRLLERFGSAQGVIQSESDWKGEKGLQEFAVSLRSPSYQEKVRKEGEWLQNNSSRVISLFDPEYPPLLKQAHQAPPILFFRGSFKTWQDKLPIAFVGTRTPSEYGQKTVEMLVEGLAGLKVVIVSGFASGIDTFAHQAALRVGLETMGVLGTGLDLVYPRENRALAESLVRHGALLTQFPTGTEPLPWNFPERNRIIAGAARATLVIEAREKSGALITAQIALEEGREVLAVPGSIFSMKNRGCHRLIQQGAKLVNGVEDVLEELRITAAPQKKTPMEEKTRKLSLEPEENLLFGKITLEPLHIDKIAQISNLPASSVAGVLTTLSLKGLIEELPGKFYVRS